MKLIIKLSVVLLVLALFLPMWLKGPDGEPVMDLQDWVSVPNDMGGVVDSARGLLDRVVGGEAGPAPESLPGAEQNSAPGQFYRWQDESGAWHFSDKPLLDGQQMAAESLPLVSNRMDSVVVPKEKPVAPTGTPPAMGSTITPPLPEGVSKEAIEEMLQEAHERRMGDQL